MPKAKDGQLILTDPIMIEDNALLSYSDIDDVGYFKTVGARANAVYKTGRIIPLEQQAKCINDAVSSKRQMTMYLTHPKGDSLEEKVFGNIADVAAIVESYHLDEKTGKTHLDKIRLLPTENGVKVKTLFDAGIKLGVSQRAIGTEVEKKIDMEDGSTRSVVVTDNLLGIYGWDFLQLETANAGDATEIQPLTDQQVFALTEGSTLTQEDEQMADKTTKREEGVAEVKDEAKVPEVNTETEDGSSKEKPVVDKDEAIAQLAAANKSLADSVKATLDGIEQSLKLVVTDGLKERMAAEESKVTFDDTIWGTLRHSREELDSIIESDMSEEEKNGKLTKLGSEMKEVLSGAVDDFIAGQDIQPETAGMEDSTVVAEGTVITDSKEDKDADAKIEEETKQDEQKQEENNEAKPVVDEQKLKESVEESNKVSKGLKEIADKLSFQKLMNDKRKLLFDSIQKLDLVDEAKSAVSKTVEKALETLGLEEVSKAVIDAVEIFNQGKVAAKLEETGYTRTGGESKMVEVIRDEVTQRVLGVTDSLVDTGHFHTAFPGKDTEDPNMTKELKGLLDAFDKRFEGELKLEADRLAVTNGKHPGVVTDAMQAADFSVPRTISRIVLKEVYSDEFLTQLTNFVIMESPREQIPITVYTRETGGVRVYDPTVGQRHEIKVPELTAIKKGKLSVSWYNIDAESRKLAATLSDEFLTRAKRRPNIVSAAKAIQNLVTDVKRCLMVDLFEAQVQAALGYGSTAFSFAEEGDGIVSSYRVNGTTDADCKSVVPGYNLVVKCAAAAADLAASTAVPEYGTSATGGGTGDAYFYVLDAASATVYFVDEDGAALPPPDSTLGDNITVDGYKADGETRFNMWANTTEWSQHMNGLLFAVQNKLASGASVSGYDRDFILSSAVSGNYMKQAKAYTPMEQRKGFSADAAMLEGNLGFTGGAGHWASKIFSDRFILCGVREGTVFGNYEPLQLKGPSPARDGDGALIGGDEYYSYQEDSLTVPIWDKFGMITLYTVSS